MSHLFHFSNILTCIRWTLVNTHLICFHILFPQMANNDNECIQLYARHRAKLHFFYSRIERCPGVVWENKEKQMFRIPWSRKNHRCSQQHKQILKDWAQFKCLVHMRMTYTRLRRNLSQYLKNNRHSFTKFSSEMHHRMDLEKQPPVIILNFLMY